MKRFLFNYFQALKRMVAKAFFNINEELLMLLVILNYRANSVREKITSKSLKAFLRGSQTVGKFTENIVNKDNLVVEINIKSPKGILLILLVILNYRADSIREKITSKSLKAFLRGSRTVGKFTGNIVNKDNLVVAINIKSPEDLYITYPTSHSQLRA